MSFADFEKFNTEKNVKFHEVWNNKKFKEGIYEHYAEDAAFMPPGHPTIIGRDGIEKFISGMASKGVGDMALTVDALSGSYEYPHERGQYVMKGADGSVIDEGKYCALYKKVDGDIPWLCIVDIFNSNKAKA